MTNDVGKLALEQGPISGGKHRIVVALSGASGTIYARKLLACLANLGMEVHVTISDGFFEVLRCEEPEAKNSLRPERVDLEAWCGASGSFSYYHNKKMGAPISSGSFQTRGMIVAPCSLSTLGNIAHGTGKNLGERAADVCLKEGRRLALLLRESPLSAPALENALKLARLGVHILPTSPAFYIKPKTINDLVEHTVARTLDLFEIPHNLSKRWGETSLPQK